MAREDRVTPGDRGEVTLRGRCQICGNEGLVVAVVDAPTPNQFCESCAIEYGDQSADVDEPRA